MLSLQEKIYPIVFLLLVLHMFVISASNTSESCVVEEIQVQSNFDIEKFSGKWYEILWIPHIPESLWLIDYTVEHKQLNETALFGKGTGRPKDGGKCDSLETIYTITSVPGKLRKPPLANLPETDYWVVSTDYDNYLFIYGCIEKDQNDNRYCAEGKIASWVFSRKPTLAEEYMQKVDQLIENHCINKTHYVETSQDNDCSEDTSGSQRLLFQLNIVAFCVAVVGSLVLF